jgi:hypothetical protein
VSLRVDLTKLIKQSIFDSVIINLMNGFSLMGDEIGKVLKLREKINH